MRKITQKWAFFLMTLLCLVGMSQVVMAQNCVEIGEGTSAGSGSIPVASWYHYSYTQQLFTADEIGQGAGSIVSIGFQYNNTSSMTRKISIFMANTDSAAFGSNFIREDLTEVLSPTVVTFDNTASWVVIDLENSFAYTGGNLVVAIYQEQSAEETLYSSGSRFLTFASTGMARYKQSDSQFTLGTDNAPSDAGTALSYRTNTQFCITPSGGPVIVCDKPDDPAVTDITSTSAMLAIAGGSQSYNVEIKGGAYEDWTFLAKNTTNTSISLTGLTPYTSYSVRVQSVCDGGNTSGYKTVSFKTLIGIPFSDGLGVQGEWTKATGLLDQVMAGTVSLASGGTWNFGARHDVLGEPHAYMNLYGTGCKNWIISPFIPLPDGGNYVLTYQVALTDWNNADPIEHPDEQQDDKLIVLVSTDSCHTWNILQQWDNEGSSYVYNQIPVDGEEVEIDLSAYAGQEIQIAFYGESTVAGGDNDIHVGHVLIDYAPSCMTPDGLVAVDANTTKTSVQLDWNAKSGETAWILEYKKATDENYTTLNITEKPYTLNGLQEFSEYNVRVAGKCSDAEDGTSKFCKPVTVKTASGVPFFQSFDTATLISEWVRYEALLSDVLNEGAALEATKKGWDVAAANDIFTSADYHLVLNLKDSTSKYWIVGPTIEMEANQQLTFDLAFTKAAGNKQAIETGKQNSQKFYVFVTTNGGASWAELAKWTNSGDGFSLDGINTEGQLAKVDLTAYAANSIKLAFYGESTVPTDASNNLHIANVKIAEIPACSKPTSLNITGIKGTTATAVWESDEDGLWQYGYVVKPTGDFVPADSMFIDTTSATILDMAGLAETTHYMFFVRRICDNDTSEALVKEFATIQTPVDLPYENDFEAANGWKLINGELENHWVWGESARANNTPGGSKALYISNDNLGTYAYTRATGKAAMVYAVKTFYFDQAGMYSFQYDWKCWGYSTNDYLRVALIPADVELEAATTVPTGFTTTALPEGWTALDGGSKLNLDSAWNHELAEITIDKAGYYQMVFAWRNYTYTSGKNPPAAVDNVKVARITCTKPSHLAYSNLEAESVSLSWDAAEGATFEYALVTAAEDSAFALAPAYIEVPGGANAIQFDTLAEKTNYKFYLRKVCGGEDGNSDVISIEFKTKPLPFTVPWNENFESATANAIPEYWDNTASTAYETTTTKYYIWGVYNYSSGNNKMIRMYNSLVKAGTAVINTPKIALPTSPVCALSFDYSNLANCGAFTVKISEDDGQNWVDLKSFEATGSTNTTNPGTFTPAEIRLEGYEGKIIMLQFFANANYGAGAIFVDNIKIEEAPSCVRPTELAVIDSLTTTSSATITWTPGLDETNWLVQYKKSADSVWAFVPDSVLADTLVLTGLEAANTYDVRVAAWCNTADSTAISEYTVPVTVATLCEPYSIALQGDFTEGFEDYEGVAYNVAGITPVCWETGGTSTYAAPHVVKSGTYAYVHEGQNALNFCASANSYVYAMLPEFTDSLKFLQIGFWAQMENASNGALYLGYVDDSLSFYAMATYANNTGSMAYYETKLDTIPDAARRLAFVWQREGSSFYSCCIDDIKISYIPNCQKPENVAAIDSLATANSVILKWDAQGSETAWVVQYKEATDSVWTTIAADNDSAFVIDGLKAATYYDVQVAALCGATDTSEYSIPVTIHTGCALVAEFPYNENFDLAEATKLPLCWSKINAGTNTTYNVYPYVYNGASYAKSGTKSLKFYSYYSSTAGAVTDQYAILPEMDGISALRLRFNARKYSASYDATFTVGVMADPADASTYVAIDTIKPAAATYEPFKVLFNAYEGGGKYIAIKMNAPTSSYKGVHIDDIVVDSIPNCLEPDSLQAVLIKGQGTIATLKWAAGAASAWEVQYGMDAKFAGAITANVNEPTLALTGLTSDSTYYARVKAICSETEESDWSNVISFTPMNAVIVNDGTTTGSYVPFYGLYIDDGSNSQFIIPEKEIATIQWDSITKLTFFSSTASQTWDGTLFDIYVMETPDTVLTSMVPWTSMKKVVNSKHLVLADKQMEVTFDKPFQYQGGNLLIGFNETVTGTYGSCSWYGKTGVSGNSMYQYAANAATKSNFNPKVKIDHVHGEAPSCFVVKNITVSDITPSSAVLNWTPGEEGQNAWQVVYSADPAFDLAAVAAEDIHDVAALPYALAGLETDTLYNVYVRANCSEGENEDYSLWSELFTFHTASSCQNPDNIKADSITTSSALISWNTYGQTLFNLLYTDGTNIDTLYNVECPYLLEGLEMNTAYAVKVQAACAPATSWSSQATFKTARGIPFEEKFDATTMPADWSQYSGLLSNVLNGTARTSATAWYFGASNGVFDSHARCNIYGTVRYHWLDMPTVYVENDAQLTFDLALTKYSGTLQQVVDTLQKDDKFVVLISLDEGDTWSILRQWDNDSSEYVYNNIACTAEGEQVVISLAAYNGKAVKIAFYGESTSSTGNNGGDNNLHIDNVLIDRVPTCLKPTGLKISDVKAHKATISWTAGDEGQSAWQIAYVAKNATTKPDTLANIIDVTANPYVLENLDPSTTYYVYVRANCGADDGVSRWADGKSFTTTVACPAPKNLQAVLTPGNGTIATLKWTAGGDEQSWRVEYSANSNMSDSIAVVVDDTIYNIIGLTAETTYYARVLADCGELDSLSVYSTKVEFTPTSAYRLTLNDGTTTNAYVPINGSNVDEGTRSQFIIPEEALEEIEWDSIKSLTFYASQTSVDWGAAQFEVYVAEAQETTISEEADWTAMTKVMNAATLSIADKKMVVTFDSAYQYTGGNLMIGFYQTITGSWKASSWYGKTIQGASMGGYGTGNNYAQRNFLPKMMIDYVPGVAPACPNPKKLQVVSVAADSAIFSWKAVEGASWEYAVALASAAEPTEFNAVPEGANTIVVNGLTELTSYVFYLRRACGVDGNSEIVSVPFETLEIAEEISYSYNEDFENANGWKLINGTEANAWMIGSATNYGGENALYISNDGASYDYDDETASVTYATKLFHFVRTGTFTVSYDYKCVGEFNDEDGALDYLRVALIPSNVALTAGTLLTDLVQPLDHDSALVAQSAWTRMSAVASIPTVGLYRLVFIWSNDDADSDGVPAAIDNLLIVHKDNATDIENGAGIQTKAVKFIRDNHVYILINGNVYDMTGRKVEIQ